MKPVWTPLRLGASVLGTLLGCSLFGQGRDQATGQRVSSERNSERKLTGVLPGHTTLQRGKAILGEPSLDYSENRATWTTCSGKKLVIEADQWRIVNLVRVAWISSTHPRFDCVNSASGESKWVTGPGPRLGDSTERVTQLYGQPDWPSPSRMGPQQLELLYFDSRGPKVTQVMSAPCSPGKVGKPGRVVEITLAVRKH